MYFFNTCNHSLLFRIEQYYDAIMALWNQLYINMKSLVSWHYCMIDIEKIKAMTIAKVSVDPASVIRGNKDSLLLHQFANLQLSASFLDDVSEPLMASCNYCIALMRGTPEFWKEQEPYLAESGNQITT